MASYRGQAVVVDHDGQLREVDADLTFVAHAHSAVSWMSRWRGRLSGDADWWRLWDRLAFVELRLPDGRAGQVLVKRPTTTYADVIGAGECPFLEEADVL
jgi:hypothetical protein